MAESDHYATKHSKGAKVGWIGFALFWMLLGAAPFVIGIVLTTQK